MNAICLVIDRLHWGYLGTYGNAWIETPAVDRLASAACVFDQAMVETPRLDALYRSYWHGLHVLAPTPPDDRPTLARMLGGAGVYAELITDERDLAEHPLASGFAEKTLLDLPVGDRPAAEGRADETHLARCFGQVIGRLEAARSPFLLWCHLGSLGRTWDAPLGYREQYRKEGDADLPTSSEAPTCRLHAGFKPPAAQGFSYSYAGQVTLLDACIEALDGSLREGPLAGDTMLVLTSPRGFPLGEHGRVGPCDDALYGELVHVPLLIRTPGGLDTGARSQALVGPADLWATLLDYWQIAGQPPAPTAASLMPLVRQEPTPWRERLVLANGHERAFRTPAWYLRQADEPELYSKPDDCWEANNVAARCHDVVEGLQDALVRCEEALKSGESVPLPPLDEILRTGLE